MKKLHINIFWPVVFLGLVLGSSQTTKQTTAFENIFSSKDNNEVTVVALEENSQMENR